MNAINKLGLGTVQWGLVYGVANCHGMTSRETVANLLAEARDYGIKVLDTASLYGKSEAVMGTNSLENFNIVTKTPKFSTSYISDIEVSHLENTFQKSLDLLSITKIYGLLIHHAENLFVPGGENLLAAMMRLKERGLIEKIGVSVYDSKQVDAVMKKFKPDLIQLPFSVIDQRMLASGHLEQLKNKGVEVHVRSVFLQGLMLMPLDSIPKFFEPVRPLLIRFHAAAQEQGLSVNQAALSFVKNIPYVDTVLVGIDNLVQLRECFNNFTMDLSFDATGLACNDSIFVNPSLWQYK